MRKEEAMIKNSFGTEPNFEPNGSDNLFTVLKKVEYIYHIISLEIDKIGDKGMTAKEIKERIDYYKNRGQIPNSLILSVEEIDYICYNLPIILCLKNDFEKQENVYTNAFYHGDNAAVLKRHDKS